MPRLQHAPHQTEALEARTPPLLSCSGSQPLRSRRCGVCICARVCRRLCGAKYREDVQRSAKKASTRERAIGGRLQSGSRTILESANPERAQRPRKPCRYGSRKIDKRSHPTHRRRLGFPTPLLRSEQTPTQTDADYVMSRSDAPSPMPLPSAPRPTLLPLSVHPRLTTLFLSPFWPTAPLCDR